MDQPQRASIVDSRLSDLVERFGDDGYRAYLESLRWPHGPECPRCGSTRITWLEARAKYACYGCRYQFRVTAGTLFHDSHVSLEKWLLAVALMLVSERGIPATQLPQILGGSYKTAWFLEHRIRAAMIEGVEGLGPLVALADESEQAAAAPDGTLAVTPRRVDSPPSAAEWRISVRSGAFRAHPLVAYLLGVSALQTRALFHSLADGDEIQVPGPVRASIGLGARTSDIDALVDALQAISARRR